jgi:ubiquinone biosynthesis protein
LVKVIGALLFSQSMEHRRIAGRSLARAFERLGGAFLKAGQILSARVDLLSAETRSCLACLRDNVHPVPFRLLENSLQPLLKPNDDSLTIDVENGPLASATIAQVNLGTERETGRWFAIKIRRPGIDRILRADVAYIRFFAWCGARLFWFRRLPVVEATEEVCIALLRQLDFPAEAQMLLRFRELFADDPKIKIPDVDITRSTADLIVMEYLDGYEPIPNFRDRPQLAQSAVLTGLRALYRMIFEAGLIHCDLHPSNILCNEDGRVALLDFGFVAEMTPEGRRSFAEFFLSIAFGDGKTAARIVIDTAKRISRDFRPDLFEQDIQVLLDKTAGRKAADFQVAGFVYELFAIQRRHGVYGSPQFTLPILSLLTYEGLIKDIYPDIDFQQEAVPFVMASLAATAR